MRRSIDAVRPRDVRSHDRNVAHSLGRTGKRARELKDRIILFSLSVSLSLSLSLSLSKHGGVGRSLRGAAPDAVQQRAARELPHRSTTVLDFRNSVLNFDRADTASFRDEDQRELARALRVSWAFQKHTLDRSPCIGDYGSDTSRYEFQK